MQTAPPAVSPIRTGMSNTASEFPFRVSAGCRSHLLLLCVRPDQPPKTCLTLVSLSTNQKTPGRTTTMYLHYSLLNHAPSIRASLIGMSPHRMLQHGQCSVWYRYNPPGTWPHHESASFQTPSERTQYAPYPHLRSGCLAR